MFRSLLLSEYVDGPLREAYFQPHSLKGVRIADPFMGGGTPIVEANRIGCDVVGFDINPMAYWIVRQAIDWLDIRAYREATSRIYRLLEEKVGGFYQTLCLECSSPEALVKYFLWVKITRCTKCGKDFDLFPGFLLAENRRHPKNVIVCSKCGELSEVSDRKNPGKCQACRSALTLEGPASRNRCVCAHCEGENSFPSAASGPPRHRMFAIEYHCPRCKSVHAGRFFKKPDTKDLLKYERAAQEWRHIRPTFVPDDEIPSGDESDRLHRWGYRRYREMFNERQLLGLELICREIAREPDGRVRGALATNLSDLLRYQNMLCRYDAGALKSLDIFSVHGFPVGLVECESNLLGIPNGEEKTNIGSGGWSNIVEKFTKAKRYCENPFEVMYEDKRKREIHVVGEWIGGRREGHPPRRVSLACRNSMEANLARSSLDGVFTDPPYYSNVQYAELMDFCYVWLRRLVGATERAFARPSTRNEDELTVNVTMDRGLAHYTEGLSAVFAKMAGALKPGSPFVFTYHHNVLEAYFPIAVALLDARLVCSASLPCPAEMGASIHINRTGSSIVDTVFVCRSTGRVPGRTIVSTASAVADLVREDLAQLGAGGMNPTQGDARCIAHGHLVRLAVWNLRANWNKALATDDKIRSVGGAIQALGGLREVESALSCENARLPRRRLMANEEMAPYGHTDDEIPF